VEVYLVLIYSFLICWVKSGKDLFNIEGGVEKQHVRYVENW
jgi:hypothetical protein